MAQSAPLILRIVASSVSAANQAGKIIRDVMSKGELGIVDKGVNDLQTEADRTAQRCIVSSLSKQFPSIKIIGEEDQGGQECPLPPEWLVTDSDPGVLNLQCPKDLQNVKEEEVVVWVDPLDGTSEYTQGLLDHVTVLIGVAVGERAVGGVIHQPYFEYQKFERPDLAPGRTIWGIPGVGTGGFEPRVAEVGKRIVTTTRSHSNALVQSALDAIQPTEVLRVGGAGHKVMLLLEGKAHAYVFASAGCKKWDTCAPEAILSAAGGTLTDMLGRPYLYHASVQHLNASGVLAAATKEDHAWYASKVPDSVRQKLSG
ncbi:3'(2'),5'-bisphosphate nucleotidase 1 [Neocloeon triangulifer]|uniref:3'(2'),5'-bisphosphate nucleotidase 1 n=1 Tax=Neocloeon triangulifer TaxID=2078957 RepID=UPI00286F9F4D|nr:3'(2'),5'-bisphosphate nucleotidase 1 [Neocloeon triangulifer]